MTKPKFKIWPEPEEGKPYGPSPKQKLLFIEDLPVNPPEHLEFFKRPHLHPVDVVLYIGGARCFGINTPILMYDGTIKMVQDIQVGDLLMGPDSKPRTVTELHRGRDQMYKVTPLRGDSFICNENHILSLQTSAFPEKYEDLPKEWKKSKNYYLINNTVYSTGNIKSMSVKDYLNLPKRKQQQLKLYHSNSITFKSSGNLRIDPYFLGLWLGDGSSKGPDVTTMDKEIEDYIDSYANSLDLKVKKYQTSKRASSLHITTGTFKGGGVKNRNILTKHLRQYSLLKNKHIPHDFLTSSIKSRLQLLAGLIDTDGTLDNNTSYCIYQKNEVLAKDIAFLARSLGFGVTVIPTEVSWKSCYGVRSGNYQRITIYGEGLNKIPVRLPRKSIIHPCRRKSSHLVSGFELEPLGEGDYYGFSVSGPDQLFLLGDFTVTHNSGKTISACARTVKYLLDNPGSTAIMGAINRPLLWRSVVKVLQEMFSTQTPWDHLKLPNRLITRKPTMNEPRIEFVNGSVMYLLHFSDPEILKGIPADICEFEEADLLKDEGAFEELLARLSGKKGPLRQLILTTNPVKASKGWIRDKFKLWQMKPDFKGELEPIVKPCQCQFCQPCLNSGLGEWEFVDIEGNVSTKKGSKCSNPQCAKIVSTKTYDKTSQTQPEIKDNDCPGNQVFYRVIQTSSVDNIHIPSDYAQSAARGMSEATAAAMVRGEINENTEGLVYGAFSDNNVLKVNQKLDLNKDLLWSLDFNYEPQCSVIAQETETEDGFSLTVIDEIIKWHALPEQVAKEFCARYHKFKYTDREVLLYSDPAGLYGGSKDLKPTFYQTIVDILRKPTNEYGEYDPENGKSFKVKIMMRIDPKPYTDSTREKIKVPVSDSVDAVNAMLRNDLGEVRLFINQACRYLIASLEGVEYAADGVSIFKKIDEYAKTKSKDIVRPMTHPTDALRYLVYKRFPLLKGKKGFMVIQTPGESSLVYRSGKLEERLRTDENLRIQERKSEKQLAREERKKERRLKREQKAQSLGTLIEKMRKSPFGFFYY